MRAALRYVTAGTRRSAPALPLRDGEAVQRVLPGPAADPGWTERDLWSDADRDDLAVSARTGGLPALRRERRRPLVRMGVLRVTDDYEHVSR